MMDHARAGGASVAIACFLFAAISQAAWSAETRTWWDGYSVATGRMTTPHRAPRQVGDYSILLTAMQPPGSPVEQPPPATDSPVTQPTPEPSAEGAGGVDQSAFESAFRDFASQLAASGASAPDTGSILANAPDNETVRVQRRSQVSFDPRIRGYRLGQIYTQADGAYWRPAREDLDAVLSKINPILVEDIRVVNGPYAVQYGPGFAFIDATTADTPRYDCGFEAHNTMGLTYRTNGDQWYGYDSFEGGSDNWGYRVAYGNRLGVDYESGDGTVIPSSYHNQDYLAQIGYSFNPFQRLEFRYMHLDQTDTEYFLRIFDITSLKTDAFNLRLVDDSPEGPWSRFVVEGWYNDTPYHGDTSSPGKAMTLDRIERALEVALPGTGAITFAGNTAGGILSTGARTSATFGDEDEMQLMVGADVRYLKQQITEGFTIAGTGPGAIPPGLAAFASGQPRSYLIDPGAFASLSVPMNSYWTAAIGARGDWVFTDSEVDPTTTLLPGGADGDVSNEDALYAYYLTNDVELDCTWTANFGFGYAQRPPTLSERYGDGFFPGTFQTGFARVIGNTTLEPEKAYQVDVGLRADGEVARGGARAFQSWIVDYSTYDVIPIAGLGGAVIVTGRQTEFATLTGFELYGDYDWSSTLNLFANLSYVQGKDHEIQAPMTSIYPMEGRVGIRLHDPTEEDLWAIEFFGRIVDDQDRLGALLNASGFGTTPVELPTQGFTVWHLRASAQATRALRLTAGVENLFDKNYLEHLDTRLPADGAIPAAFLYSPGITPYAGAEWRY